MTNKRAGFARQRKSCGFTQESFAQALEVDRTTVQRWERGEGSPQPHIRPKLARALKVTPAELDALLFHDLSRSKDPAVYRVAPSENGTTYAEDQDYLDVGDLDEMIRREFLRLMSIAGAAISATETQFAAGEIHELAVSGEFVSLDRMNSHLWQIFSLSSSKETVYPVVREQLCELTRRLKAAKTQGAHRQLCATAGDLFQIAGEIFFDGNRYTDAAHSYALAASASKEAGDYDLWACALTRHAFIGMYEQRFDEASPLLDAAELVARRGDSQMSTRYWVAAVRAEVFARLGDFDACNRALDEAEEVQSLSGRIHNGGWLRFDGSRLAEERGTCYVALGRPDLAEAALMDALKQPLSSRRRSGVLTDLAVLGIQRRDIDQLLTYAHAVMELAQQTHSGYIGRKLQELQGSLAPLLSDHRVSHLNEQISALSPVE